MALKNIVFKAIYSKKGDLLNHHFIFDYITY